MTSLDRVTASTIILVSSGVAAAWAVATVACAAPLLAGVVAVHVVVARQGRSS